MKYDFLLISYMVSSFFLNPTTIVYVMETVVMMIVMAVVTKYYIDSTHYF